MHETVRLGLIGAGQIAQMCHLAPIRRNGLARLVALADLRPNLLAKVAEVHGIPASFQSHESLIEQTKLDGVIVVVNRPATGPIVRDCLAAELPVLTEKPLTHTVAQAASLVQRVEAWGGPILTVGYMKRYDPGFYQLQEVVETLKLNQRWGPLERVEAWSLAGDPARPSDGFIMTPEARPAGLVRSTGLEVWPIAPDWLPASLHGAYADFLNVHVHALNWLSKLTGPLDVDRVVWDGHTGFDIEMTTPTPTMRVTLTCGQETRPDWNEGVRLTFSHGVLTLRFPAPFAATETATLSVESGTLPFWAPKTKKGWAFTRQIAHFVDCLAGRQVPLVTGAEALEDLKVAEAIWRRLAG